MKSFGWLLFTDMWSRCTATSAMLAATINLFFTVPTGQFMSSAWHVYEYTLISHEYFNIVDYKYTFNRDVAVGKHLAVLVCIQFYFDVSYFHKEGIVATIEAMFNRLYNASPILLATAILVGTAGLLSYAWFQLSTGYLHGDALIFQTVGRGWLHGAVPYRDLFETKPPGVFLLHALSWKLVGSQLLVSIATVLALIGVAVRAGAPVLGFVQGRPAADRRFLSLLSVLFGIELALYMVDQAGGGLAETYGAYFAIAFLTALITVVKYANLKPLLLGGLLLLAVGFKEPFLLSIIAGAILLIDTPGDAIKTVAIPLLIAAVLGVISLLVFGLFSPFFEVYLPHMLGFHVYQHDGSTFIRALEIWRTFINLGAFSWGLAIAMTVLWLSVARLMPLRWLVASYLTFLSIAIGGDFYGHHFVFAVPMYVAMWWVLLRDGAQQWVKLSWGVIATALMLSAFTATKISYATEAAQWRSHEVEMKSMAVTIDTVMDACGYEQYLQMIPRVGDTFAYTNHVPYGPIFLHYSRFIGAFKSYSSAHIKALQEAPLALFLDIEDANLSEQAKQFIRSNFSMNPPACAQDGFVQQLPYTLYFRLP